MIAINGLSTEAPVSPAAVVFDLDGVIGDTESASLAAFAAAFGELGLVLTTEDLADMVGLSLVRVDELMRERHGIAFAFEELRDRYRGLYLDFLHAGVSACAGAAELVASLSDGGVPIAVASSSPRTQVDLVLASTGVAPHVQASAAGDEVAATKPAPDVYLLALERLGVPPSPAVVAIEDSPAGVAAAVAAGLRCVGVQRDASSPELPGAALVVQSLAELMPADLGRLATAVL